MNLNNPLEVYKLLPKSNCRKCFLPSCLAFAAAVVQGEKKLKDCPDLDQSIADRGTGDQNVNRTSVEKEMNKKFQLLQSQIAEINFSSRTGTLGGSLENDKLAISCLGKYFFISSKGNITSECHINPWVAIPILDYIINCQGNEPQEKWVPFRELPNGQSWNPLFLQRCEKPLKKVADNYTDLFENLVEIFSGRRTAPQFDSDVAIILYPLPKIPILICYWKPEDDMESMLNIFFDQNVEKNISIESLYSLSTGLVIMFEKISLTHG